MSFDIGRQTEQTSQFWSLTQGRLFTCKGSSLGGKIRVRFLAIPYYTDLLPFVKSPRSIK
jgi:hypothetical protein